MTKQCRKCHGERPIEQFGRHPQMRDGYLNHCKPCVAVRQKALYEAQRAERIAASKAYYHANADRILEESRRRYATDPDFRASRLSASRSRPRVYRPEQSERARAYRNAKLESYQFNERRARALRFGVPEGLTLGEWQAMLGRVGGCAYCGGHDRIGVDHVVPLSRGGAHEAGNVVPCCLRCNASKFNLTLVEWLFSSRKRAAVALAHLTGCSMEAVAVAA